MLTQVNQPQGSLVVGGAAPTLFPSPRGAVLFVLSTVGRDSKSRLKYFGSGTSQTQGSVQGPVGDPIAPLASVFGTDGAVAYCSAGRGDIIYVLPGHTETISAAKSVPSGVTIIGLGPKTQRPAFTLGTAITANISLGQGASMQNCYFDLTGFDAITAGITLTGAGSSLIGNRILQSGASNQAILAISLVGSDCVIDGNEIDATGGAGAAAAIQSGGACSRQRISNNLILGDFSVAPLSSASTNHITLMVVENNILHNTNGTAKAVISFTTSSTGYVRNNTFIGTTWSTAADALAGSTNVALRWTQNYGFDDGAGAVSGVLVPAVGTIA